GRVRLRHARSRVAARVLGDGAAGRPAELTRARVLTPSAVPAAALRAMPGRHGLPSLRSGAPVGPGVKRGGSSRVSAASPALPLRFVRGSGGLDRGAVAGIVRTGTLGSRVECVFY